VTEAYLLATEQQAAIKASILREALGDDNVEFADIRGCVVSVRVNSARTDIRFEKLKSPIKLSPELMSGSDESIAAVKKAKSVYRISFAPGHPQPSVAVFETLWCIRTLMEQVPGILVDVMAQKLHDLNDVQEITELDFDIRDHINLHAIEVTEGDTPMWIHSHGMEKFGTRDVEAFHIAEADLPPAESFLHRLCTDLAFGQGPKLRTIVETGDGESFMLVSSEEARQNLMGIPLETFEDHQGQFLTVVSANGRHTLAGLLKQYREHFAEENPEKTEALRLQAQELLPAFKARFLRKGLMEPLTFLVRAPFEVHPDGSAVNENLWLEVLTWEGESIVGKIVDGAAKTTEWRKGAQVEIDDEQINALGIAREGQPLDGDDIKSLLLAEKPM
jgi:hypothetical protein